MKIADQLHKSRTHRDGFDRNCPKCLLDHGIPGIIADLKECAGRNEGEPKDDIHAHAVASEQRRMIAVLSLFEKARNAQVSV